MDSKIAGFVVYGERSMAWDLGVMHHYFVTEMVGAAAVLICDGQAHQVSARLRISVRWVLFCRSVSIAKIPFPSTNDSIARRLIREIKGRTQVRLMKIKGSMADPCWQVMYYHMVTECCRTIWIMRSDGQTNIVGAIVGISMHRVLFGARLAVAEVPEVSGNISVGCGLVVKGCRVSVGGEMKTRVAVLGA